MKTDKLLPSINLKSVFNWFLVFGFSFFSLRFLFFNKLQYGHNWDFTFPSFLSSNFNLNFPSFFAWNSNNFGYQQHLTGAHLIPNFLYSFLSTVFGVVFASKIILFLVLIFGVINFYIFTSKISKLSSLQRTLVSMFYSFCPFLFNEVVGGSWYMWLSFSFAPLYIFSVLDFIDSQNYKKIFSVVLSSIFVIPSLQNFVLAHCFLLIWFVIKLGLNLVSLKKFLVWHFSLLITNLYWILLTVANLSQLSSQFTSSQFTNQFDQVKNSSQSLSEIFSLGGYLDRHFYIQALPINFVPFYQLVIAFLWLVSLFAFFSKEINKQQKIVFGVFTFSLFFVKGGNLPFSNLSIFLFSKIPLMSLYRSPQHLMFIIQFAFVLLLTTSLQSFNKFLGYFWSNTILICFFFAYSFGWWYKGDLGYHQMKQNGRDYIGFFGLEPGLLTAYKLSEENDTGLRHLILPITQSPLYISTNHQESGQGGISEYMYFKTPTFTAETTKLGAEIESYLCNFETEKFDHAILKSSVGFITLRKDLQPIFTNCSKNWQPNKVFMFLSSNPNLKLIVKDQNTFTFLVKNPHTIVSMVGQADGLRVKRINPTKYWLSPVSGTNSAQIILNETFNDNWKIVDSNSKMIARSTLVNGLNFFHINSEINPENNYFIVFSLQKKYEIFMAFSLSFFISLFIWSRKR